MEINFQNKGLLDMRAITTFGVSVKETENPIGFFGTGLKYAIAIVLRNGGSVEIWRGEERFDFSTEEELFRGKEFSSVFMTGPGAEKTRLGFTTELGKTWEPWQAFRELESNCMDEKGKSFSGIAKPTSDSTIISVSRFAAFEEAFFQKDNFFLNATPLWACLNMEIHNKPGILFYRNVRVALVQDKGLFGYNMLRKTELTEDRTPKDKWMMEYNIRRDIVQECDNEELLETILCAKQDTFEGRLDFDVGLTPSDTFYRVVSALMLTKRTINKSAKALLTRFSERQEEFVEIELTWIQKAQLEKAKEFLTKVFDFRPNRYPIIVVDSLNGEAYGLARHGTIYVSRDAFNLGTKMVAAVLLEEYIHLDTDFLDCTRALQNHFLKLCITLGEQLRGEPL